MEKIVKMSRVLKRICFIFIWVIPIFNLGFWITNGYPFLQEAGFNLSFIPTFSFSQNLDDLRLWQKLAGFFVTMIPVGFITLSFYWLTNLFSFFAKLEIFTKNSVHAFRNFALTLLISQFFYPLYTAFISFILTIHNPVGDRIIVMKFGASQLILLAVAYAIFLVSWIMDEGRKLDEDVKATI